MKAKLIYASSPNSEILGDREDLIGLLRGCRQFHVGSPELCITDRDGRRSYIVRPFYFTDFSFTVDGERSSNTAYSLAGVIFEYSPPPN